MSLALLQGYSSSEEEAKAHQQDHELLHRTSSDDEGGGDDDDDDEEASAAFKRSMADRSLFDLPQASASGLPSAFDAFSEVSGPPGFLKNSVEEYGSSSTGDVDQQLGIGRHGRRRNRKDKKDLPAGAVMESKAQLVGIHERVRSDIEGRQPPSSTVSSTTQGGERVVSAANPNAEDAAELLRMCLQCGIPKTFSSARGMVCPVCGDCPPADPSNETKKKGSAIKDKEKSKRMKGQSSHATWKSETEMQLRQQFD
ncbi:hypothetical protein L484_017218 [Morus notabilis]|uniref:Uncharacterized protein n=1 Tax=Morus notabilis TaxID=981085 RepID=W9R616_9ROSA|nr:uncharacterized protein LOC21400224 [Morus notabilis]XP_024019875.1 uncharacterized protein LOC21400224 [Morus notabilis]XP_024019876.1 uncharacterized protein LOC21400224 [Morus notabilis]EXB55307.1 hypothetical protein L484_017218 [Morus notabilis]